MPRSSGPPASPARSARGRWPSCGRRTRGTGTRRTAGAPCRAATRASGFPTLAEVLWAFPTMPVLVEVKEPEVQERGPPGAGGRAGAAERCVVASEDDAALTVFRDGPVPCGASARGDRRALPGGAVPAPAPAAALPAPERAGPPPGAPGADAPLRGRGAAAGMSGARLDRKRPRHRPAPVGAGGGGGGDERAGTMAAARRSYFLNLKYANGPRAVASPRSRPSGLARLRVARSASSSCTDSTRHRCCSEPGGCPRHILDLVRRGGHSALQAGTAMPRAAGGEVMTGLPWKSRQRPLERDRLAGLGDVHRVGPVHRREEAGRSGS